MVVVVGVQRTGVACGRGVLVLPLPAFSDEEGVILFVNEFIEQHT